MTDHPTYELLQPIGTGALATVHRARDLSLQRDVAVKALKDEVRADPVRSQQLYDAAQFLAGLSHEHIVQVYGLDRDRGWLIMELLPGSLAQRLARGPLPPDLVRSVLQQALKGLQALHAQKKLHGAIKPSNLLIDDHGRVKLGDSAGLSLEGEVRRPEGGPKYLAPELINPEFGPVGPGVDLYSLGFTALELLKGPGFDRLFPGADSADPEIAWLRLHGSRGEPIPAASRVAPNTPPDLARVIDVMLAKDVKDRYDSAEEALRDLEPRAILPVDLPAAASAAPESPTFATAPLPSAAPIAAPRPARAVQQASPADWKATLKKPYILYPLLGGIIALALVLVFLSGGGGGGDDEKIPLKVSSLPTGATVFIDGQEKKNKTDFEFHLPPGKHKIQTKLDGYDPSEEREIDLKKGADAVAFTLKPHGAQPPAVADVAVRVTSETPGAVVQIDGVAQDKKAGEEFTLKPGKHKFQVFHDGYSPSDPQEVDVQPGAGPIAFGKLKPLAPPPDKTAMVHIKTDPAGATVQVDGKERGMSPLDVPLSPGTHTLELAKTGYKTLAGLQFVVKDDGVEGGLPTYTLPLLPTGPGEEFKNSIGMDLKRVKAGTFTMGSPDTEAGRAPNEGPQHDVTLTQPFYMGVYEVTQQQYQAVMGDNPSANKEGPDAGSNPVDNMSYAMAVEFCKKLSDMPEEKKAGRRYRLPTEAEWEYACRAGAKTAFSFGDDAKALDDYACYSGDAGGKTHPIGQKKPNAWGLYDMHGNVEEWCQDRYGPYDSQAAVDPQGAKGGDEKYVLRGGSYQKDASDCRCATRNRFGPRTQNVGWGFRVVCDVNSPN